MEFRIKRGKSVLVRPPPISCFVPSSHATDEYAACFKPCLSLEFHEIYARNEIRLGLILVDLKV